MSSPLQLQNHGEIWDGFQSLTEAVADERTALLAKLKTTTDVAQLCHTYGDLRQLKEIAAQLSKDINELVDKQVERMHAVFKETDTKTYTTLSNGHRYTLSEKLFASVKKDDRPALYKWLEENKLDALITDTVNSSTLSAAMKQRVEKGEDVPAIINLHFKPTISMTKTQ